MRLTRVVAGTIVFLLILSAIPLSQASFLRSSVVSSLEAPISFSREVAQWVADIFHFRQNAEENRQFRTIFSDVRLEQVQVTELKLENERLARLLDLKRSLPRGVDRLIACRVIGRSPVSWTRTLLIDKGFRDGVRVNMPVVSDSSLVGKVAETGPSVSKVILITDPNCKISVIVQRTRQQGVLFGTLSGACRVKYLSMDTPLESGDVVETAGYGGFFPKGLAVGKVKRSWKEPGQIYQVAEIEPLTDLGRLEEVACVE